MVRQNLVKHDASAVFNRKATAQAGNPTGLAEIIKANPGSLPPELSGMNQKQYGSSMFSSVAHQHLIRKAQNNLLNDETSSEVIVTVSNGTGGPITGPVKIGGKDYYANAKGEIRITDEAKVNMALKIKEHQKKRVNKIMEMIKGGDEIAAYLFGMPLEDWKKTCASNVDPATDKPYTDPELGKLNCTIENIESMMPSLTQSQHITKLRRLVAFYEPNVNMDGLSTLSETEANAKDGHNVELSYDDGAPAPAAAART